MQVENLLVKVNQIRPNCLVVQISDTTSFSNPVEYLQSYSTIIAKRDKFYPGVKGRQIWLDKSMWDYSSTTGRHRNFFLGETKAETLKKIKSGEYQLVNLN